MINMGAETGGHLAELVADWKTQGRAMPIKESLIAATARQFGLPVATRNVKDFSCAEVEVVNPFTF